MQTYIKRIMGDKEFKKNDIGEKAGHYLMIMQNAC